MRKSYFDSGGNDDVVAILNAISEVSARMARKHDYPRKPKTIRERRYSL